MHSQHAEIAIVGAGPVGLALAAMLIARGMPSQNILLIDGKTAATAQQDPRAIALSYGSRQLLEHIHAWPAAGTPITQIHISRRGSFGRSLIDCNDYALPALGAVCRYGDLVQALTATLERSGICILRPATVLAVEENEQGVHLQLADGSKIAARVMVQAEGGVFGTQAAKALHRDYRQSAIVASVHSSAAVPGRAFERFTDQGPLALLPQADGYALVWCARPESIERLLSLPDTDFLQALQQAFGQRVGRFTQISARNSYALGLNAKPAATARSIAIGNAAQTLHPVAGQGLNLGLRDANVLACLLAKAVTPATLSLFDKERRSDRSITMQLTDVMARVFTGPDKSLPQDMLGISLGILDSLPTLKQAVAEKMMFGWR